MTYSESVAEFDTAVMQACARFVTQVLPLFSLDSLAVVLLEPEQDTSRVAFTWGAVHQSETPRGPSVSHGIGPAPLGESPMCIPLQGSDGGLGAVLFRCRYEYGLEQKRLVQPFVQQLALVLENIQLQRKLQRQTEESRAFDRIAQLVASDSSSHRIYRGFAGEIKNLVSYHRLRVYLADNKADLLTCAYQLGGGRVGNGETRQLTGTVCEVAISRNQGYIVGDNDCVGESVWPELFVGQNGRNLPSALIVPVDYGGRAIGAVIAESEWPNAYGPVEERLLRSAAALLGTWITNSQLYSELKRKGKELENLDGIARALGSTHNLDEVFEHLAAAAIKLIPFESATLSWIDANGYDISTLQWHYPQSSLRRDGDFSLRTNLVFQGQKIGSLSIWRNEGENFTTDERGILDRIGVQVAPVVQNIRLYQQTMRQAYQLHQTGTPESDALPRQQLVDVAHALRSPLAVIKGYSSALLQPDVTWSAELHREFLETIDREADRLNEVAGELLAPIGNEAGAIHLDLSISTVQSLFDMARSELDLKELSSKVEFRCEQGLPTMSVDLRRLARVLVYLIGCAMESAKSKTGLLVKACQRVGSPAIVITTVDERADGFGGQGLAPSAAETMSPTGNWLEDDLRVVISRELLDAHGVNLQARPRENPAELFWFPLPAS